MTIRLRTPEDLLATIPYQLGFHPELSLVVVLTRVRRVVLLSRLDVPERESGLGAAYAIVDDLIRRAEGLRADGVLLVLYGDGSPGRRVLQHAGEAVAMSGRRLILAAIVDGGRWCEIEFDDAATGVESSWRPRPDPADCAGVAELIGLGRVALPARDDVLARVRPDQEFQAALPPLSRWQWRNPLQALPDWRRFYDLAPELDGPGRFEPSGEMVLRLARSLLARDWRDALIAFAAPGILPLDELPFAVVRRAQEAGAGDLLAASAAAGGPGTLEASPDRQVGQLLLGRWLTLATRSPRHLAAAPYCVAAVQAGHLGDGVVATAAIEEALAAHPRHVLAGLLWTLVGAGRLPGRPVDDAARNGPGSTSFAHGVG